jgi:hypothetical protein
MRGTWQLVVAALACVACVVAAPGSASAQEDEWDPGTLILSATTGYGVFKLVATSAAGVCVAIQSGGGGNLVDAAGRGMSMTTCILLVTFPFTMTTLAAADAFSGEGDEDDEEARRRTGARLALEYVAQEPDALADEVALGGGAHVEHLTGFLEVAVGGPVDRGRMGACVAREREGIWDALARRGVGYGQAAQRFIGCAEQAR